MKRSEFIAHVEEAAKDARQAGMSVEINGRLPYVAVDLGPFAFYYFQGEEASDLLDKVPDDVNRNDWILFLAQGW